MTDGQVFEAVRHTLSQARSAHPIWPKDQIHAAGIIVKEAGELMQSALQAHYEGAPSERCLAEAWHVIATAVRFITET